VSEIFIGAASSGRGLLLSPKDAEGHRRRGLDVFAVPALGMSALDDYRVVFAEAKQVFVEDPKKLDRYRVQPGDVLVANKSTCLRVAIAPDGADQFVAEASLHVVRPKHIDAHVLACFLRHSLGRRDIERPDATKKPHVTISLKEIKALPVPVRPIDIQRKLGELIRAAEAAFEAAINAALMRREMVNELALGQMDVPDAVARRRDVAVDGASEPNEWILRRDEAEARTDSLMAHSGFVGACPASTASRS
jgi:hypothetical protein